MNSDDNIDAKQFKDSLEFQWNRLPRENVYAMMNVSSTHDTPRLLSDFIILTPINTMPIRTKTRNTKRENLMKKPTNGYVYTLSIFLPLWARRKFGTAKKWGCGAPMTRIAVSR